MTYICVICTIKDASLTPLSVEHRQIIEAVVSPIIDTKDLLNYNLLLCGYCKPLLQSVQSFQQTAVAGVKKLLSQCKQVDQEIVEDAIKDPIKEKSEDPLLSPKNEDENIEIPEDTNVKDEADDTDSEATWSCESDYGGPDDFPAAARTESALREPDPSAARRDETIEVYTHGTLNRSNQSNQDVGCGSSDRPGQKSEEILYFTSFAAAFKKPKVRHKPEPAECDECHKMFSSKGAVKIHKEAKHSVLSTLKCDECGQECRGEKSLKYHKKRHKDDTPKYCVECDVQYQTIETYRLHLKTKRHATDSDYTLECNECGKKFTTRSDLIHHLEIHSDVLYPCERCAKTFKTRRERTRHGTRVHNAKLSIKHQICHYCGKAFKFKGILLDHINTHTGARPYVCKICGDTFGHKSALYLHGRFKHKITKKKEDKKEERGKGKTKDAKKAKTKKSRS